ncbi:MAG: hypothetical protein AB7W28_07535 [Armatimonadota bacterium]
MGNFEWSVDGGEWTEVCPFDRWAEGGYWPHSRLLATAPAPGSTR